MQGESDFLSLCVLFAWPFLEMLTLIFDSDLAAKPVLFTGYQLDQRTITNKTRRTLVVKTAILAENEGSMQHI